MMRPMGWVGQEHLISYKGCLILGEVQDRSVSGLTQPEWAHRSLQNCPQDLQVLFISRWESLWDIEKQSLAKNAFLI